MRKFQNVRDEALLHRTARIAARSHGITAELLEHLAEIDTRRLHLTLGYDSMKAYCVGELHFSDGAARRRVYAANVIREFPAVLTAVARGRLHLSAVLQIAPHLTAANVDELIAAATHKGRPEIDLELARLFPQAEIAPQVLVPQRPNAEARTPACTPPAPTRLAPISEKRFTLQVTIDAETHDELRELQDLLGNSVVADVLKECVHERLVAVKKRKFAQVERPGRSRGSSRSRGISAQVKRAVHARDGDRCAYVGPTGHRCNSRKDLEYDHAIPFALGGKSTVENVRLVCRIHNQHAADEELGRSFMQRKRAIAVLVRVLRRMGWTSKDAERFAKASDPNATIRERVNQARAELIAVRALDWVERRHADPPVVSNDVPLPVDQAEGRAGPWMG